MQAGLRHPARVIPLAFLVAIAVGTALLMLPAARAGPGGASFVEALFTATSAVCVTGLTVVDTASYWSGFGQGVILALVQLGGLGIMAGATLIGLLVSRRLGLSTHLLAQVETRSLGVGEVMPILRLVLLVTFSVEAVVAALLFARMHWSLDMAAGEAAWHAVFQAVSAFNNAGFSTWPDSLTRFALDPAVLVPVAAAVIVGGLGFPVLHELRRQPLRPARWSVHAKLTLVGTATLLVLGTLLIAVYEWRNPATLGGLDGGGKLLGAFFHSAMTRSGGFNTVEVSAMAEESVLVQYLLMFIGGGSAGTAGGIRVTTFFLLGAVVWAEIRGEPDSVVFRRRICPQVQRQALAVVLMSVAMIGTGTLAILWLSDAPLQWALFEVVSAFATVGLSSGLSAELSDAGRCVLAVLMYVGRVGTITVVAALALQHRQRSYRYPEERPLVG